MSQQNLFDSLVADGFQELDSESDSDDDLFKALVGEEGFEELKGTPRRKAKPKHYRPEYVCKVCSNTRNGMGAQTCVSCIGHLDRIMAVYTEAARLIPAVQGMKLSEFIERLWQREKERRRGQAHPKRRRR